MARRGPARPPTAALLVLIGAVLLAACGGAGKGSGASAGNRAATSLVARGKQLYTADGCEDCHTLNATAATGPSWKGLYESRVHLTNGRTIIATAAYLTEHIVDPDALTVSGFPGSVMAEAIQGDQLASKPADVRALVAFIEGLK
jgi:cytochrome c oxidase subunit 2